jgi:purine-cytosine permease-like protein
MIITALMAKNGLYAFVPSKNLNELHINFLLSFVSESMAPATVVLLQHYYFVKHLEARNAEELNTASYLISTA